MVVSQFIQCLACHRPIDPRSTFCPACGTPQGQRVASPPTKEGHSFLEWVGGCAVVAVLTPIIAAVMVTLASDGRPTPIDDKPPTKSSKSSAANQEGIAVAVGLERLMREAAPQLEGLLSMVDISIGERYLVVHFKPAYNRLSGSDQQVVETAIARLWRETKQVRNQGWSPDVKFVQYRDLDELRHDDSDSWFHFNKPTPPPEPVVIPAGKSEFHRRMEEAAERGRVITEENKHREAEEKAAREKEEAERAEKAERVAAAEAAAKLEARGASLMKSAEGLEKAGKTAAALQVYKQVVKDFPGTRQAEVATERIRRSR